MGARNYIALAVFFSAAIVFSGCAAKQQAISQLPDAGPAAVAGAGAYARGDYAAALAGFTESLRVNRSQDNRRAEALDLVNIGRTLVMLGELDRAIAGLEEAVGAARAVNDEPLVYEALLSLAKARLVSGDNAGAGADLDAALELAKRHRLPTAAALNLKARLLLDAGGYEEAAGVYARALKAAGAKDDIIEEANALRALAGLSALGHYKTPAMELYERAYELDRAAGNTVKIAADLAGMAGVHGKEGRAVQAAFHYERAYIVSSSSGLALDARRYLIELVQALRAAGETARAEYYISILKGAEAAE